MSVNPNVINDTYEWFAIARPEPTQKDLRTQLGCHFEEILEMMDELEPLDSITRGLWSNTKKSLEAISHYLKNSNGSFHVEHHNNLLDSICDQIVTVTGVAYCLNYNFINALNEVNRSNYSKFVNNIPVYDSNKKITKGPNYTVPNLDQFTGRLDD